MLSRKKYVELIEMMVVIVVIGIMAAMILPALSNEIKVYEADIEGEKVVKSTQQNNSPSIKIEDKKEIANVVKKTEVNKTTAQVNVKEDKKANPVEQKAVVQKTVEQKTVVNNNAPFISLNIGGNNSFSDIIVNVIVGLISTCITAFVGNGIYRKRKRQESRENDREIRERIV